MYSNILVATDISDDAERVLSRAKNIAEKYQAKLTLIHVVEPVVIETNFDLSPPINIDLEQSLTERAENFLAQLAEKKRLTDVNSIVTVGSAKHEIHRLCQHENVDLVVIGTHGRHGISMLLGSTANAILHGTSCDVLAVKL